MWKPTADPPARPTLSRIMWACLSEKEKKKEAFWPYAATASHHPAETMLTRM